MTLPNKPHIVLVDTWRVVNAKGGTEKVFCEMANALVERGYKVTAICHDENIGLPGFELRSDVEFINAYKPAHLYEKGIFRSIQSFSFNRELSREKRQNLTAQWKARNIQNSLPSWNDVEVVISFQPETTFILNGVMSINKPVITMFHMDPQVFLSKNTYKLRQDAISRSTYIQVLVPPFKDIIKKLHPNTRIVCIPNVAPQYKETSKLENKIIITVARLSPLKRADLLVKAFALLKDQYPDWVCHWYGETNVSTEYTQHIKTLIHQEKLENQFFLMGPSDNVVDKLREASIFVLSSSSEGLSLALLEALSMGLPSVCCNDCLSVKSMIQNKINGLITDPEPNHIAEALSSLINDFKLRQLLGSAAKISSKFYSENAVWGKWDNLLQSIISENKLKKLN